MALTVADLKAMLSMDTAGFTKGVQSALRDADGLTGGLKKLATSAAAMSATFVAAGAAVFGMVKHAADAGDEMQKMSRRTGIAVETLSGLKAAAMTADTSLEGLEGSLTILASKIEEARGGSKDLAAGFKRLGVDVTNTNIPMIDQFEQLAKSIGSMTNQQQALATSREFLGRGGAQQLVLLQDLKGGFKAALEESQRLGRYWTTEQGQAAEAFNDDVTRLMSSLAGIPETIGKSMIPTMAKLVQSLTDVAVWFRKAFVEPNLDVMTEKLRDTIEGQKRLISGIAETVGPLIMRTYNSLQTIVSGFLSLPAWIQDAGLIGAYFFGAKGFLVLTAISTAMGLIGQAQRAFEAFKKGLPLSEMQSMGPQDVEKYLSDLEKKFVEAREKFRFTKEQFGPPSSLAIPGTSAAATDDVKKANEALQKMIESLTAEKLKLDEGEAAALRYALAHGETAKGSQKAKDRVLALTEQIGKLKLIQEIQTETQAAATDELKVLNEELQWTTALEADLLAISQQLIPVIEQAFVDSDLAEIGQQMAAGFSDALTEAREFVGAIKDWADAQVELGQLKPEQAITMQQFALSNLRKELEAQIALTEDDALAQAKLQAELAKTDVALKALGQTGKTMKNVFSDAFDGILDILSLFGIKVGKLIIMLQQVPRALGGLEKIAAAIGGLITLSNPAAAFASTGGRGLSEAEQELVRLGNAASLAGGELGLMGSVVNAVTRLLMIFGGGLEAFGSKIGKVLSQAGIPGAELLGQGLAGAGLGLSLSALLGGGFWETAKSTVYGAIGNIILPGIGGIIGSVVGIIDAKLSGLVASLFGDGKGAKIGAQIGSMVFPVIGTFIGGLIGSFFGKTPKGKISADILPFDRNNLLSGTQPEDLVGTQIGNVLVNLGGNVMKNKEERRLQEELATMLNTLFHGVVAATIQLIEVLPERLGGELDAALSVLEQTGLEIVDKKWKGKNAGKKLKKRIKNLADEAINDLVEALGFGDLNLKELGGGKRGDAVKGFDAMIAALGTMSELLRVTKADMTGYTGSLADFTATTLEYFKQFQQEGEAFLDTVQRVGESLMKIVSLSQQIDATISAATNDTARAMQLLQDALQRVNDQALSAMDALTIEVESGGSPDAVLQAAEAAMQAVTDAMNAQIEAATSLRDALLAVERAMDSAIDLYVSLEAQIRALGGATQSLETTLPNLISLLQSASSVGQQIEIFSAAIQLIVAEGGSVIQQMPLIAKNFLLIMDAIRQMTDTQAAIANLQALANAITEGLAAAIAEIQQQTAAQVAALDAQKSGIQETTALRIDALNEERDQIYEIAQERQEALQKELDQAREWSRILDSTQSQLRDLFMLLAPLQPLTSLNEVRAQFQAALASFQASPSVAGAEKVQELARELIQLAQQTPGFDLSSAEFQSLAAEIQSALTIVEAFAAAQPSEEALQQQLVALQEATAAELESIDDQIEALRQSEQQQLAAIDQQIAALNAAAQAEIQQLQDAAVMGLQQVRDELGRRILELQQQQQEAAAALQAVIGDKTYEQYIAERQAEAVQRLDAINQTLQDYLGAILTNLFPDAVIPSHASGLEYVPYDNYRANLHRGERVLTASESADYRAGSSGGTAVNITVSDGAIQIQTPGGGSEFQREVGAAAAAVLRRGVSELQAEIVEVVKRVKR